MNTCINKATKVLHVYNNETLRTCCDLSIENEDFEKIEPQRINCEDCLKEIEKERKKIMELNASGYAGCNPDGRIVDRREFPKAVPIQENPLFGIVKPKKL